MNSVKYLLRKVIKETIKFLKLVNLFNKKRISKKQYKF